MISKEELNGRLKEQLKTVTPGDLVAINQKMTEHLHFALENYNQLTPEAQQCTDDALDVEKEHYGKIINEMPESKEKRKMRRMHAIADGKHFKADVLIEDLEISPKVKDEKSKQFKDVFVIGLQATLDLIYDVKLNTLSGVASFGQLSLLGMCVNELLVAFHLVQHQYVNQAYTHIRTVFEHVNTVELFRIKPEWAEVWCGDEEKEIKKELSPFGVRKKLGKAKKDPIYGFFSRLGPHGTFEAVKTRTAKRAKLSEKGNPEIQLWIGRCPLEHNIVWLKAFTLYCLLMVLLQISRSFEEFIDSEEAMDILNETCKNVMEYIKNHFLGWARETGLDISEMEESLNSYRETLFGV